MKPRTVYVELPCHARVYALANEDLPDQHLSRPSAVHFLRFQLPESLRVAVLSGATATLGCAHEQYEFRRVIPPETIARLRRDLAVPTHSLDQGSGSDLAWLPATGDINVRA